MRHIERLAVRRRVLVEVRRPVRRNRHRRVAGIVRRKVRLVGVYITKNGWSCGVDRMNWDAKFASICVVDPVNVVSVPSTFNVGSTSENPLSPFWN